MSADGQDIRYQAAARSLKTDMAVLAGPIRTYEGWAIVKTGKLSRAARKFVIIKAAKISVCNDQNPKSSLLNVPIQGGSMVLDRTAKGECTVRVANWKIWMMWEDERELRLCKQAFEFANRQIENFYKILTHRQLGKSRATEVVFGFDSRSGDHVAVKIMNKQKARISDREFAEKEVCIRMTVQHPCIVQTIDIFESQCDLFVIMELMNGDPLDRRLVKQNAPLTEMEAKVIMIRLFSALSYLHERAIVHRNVKPQNIFFDISDDVHWCNTSKLSDFSLACYVDDPDTGRQVAGTPEYLAPEAAMMVKTADGERQVIFGTEVDMWAAGVTLYNMLSMELPFEGDYPPEVFSKARSGQLNFSERAFRDVSPEAISLIRSLMNVDRRKRPTASTVLLHPWFDEPGDLSAEDEEEEYEMHLRELALTGGLRVISKGLARFRAAVTAVKAALRLIRRTPGLRLKMPHVEKKFEFNVSGIDIAPIKEYEERSDGGNLVEEARRQRNSTTVMSRISTGSTVKTRSSLGESLTSSIYAPLTNAKGAVRTDREADYLGKGQTFTEKRGSGGNSGLGNVHRLISSSRGDAGKSQWRWRKRQSTKDGRAVVQE